MELLVYGLDSCCFVANLVASSDQIQLPSASHRAAHRVLQLHLWRNPPQPEPCLTQDTRSNRRGWKNEASSGTAVAGEASAVKPLPTSASRGSISALVLFTICSSTRKRTRRRASCITMAAADSGAKPIQNAMKMAKVAIQLDGGNKHKVGSVAVRPQSQHGRFIA